MASQLPARSLAKPASPPGCRPRPFRRLSQRIPATKTPLPPIRPHRSLITARSSRKRALVCPWRQSSSLPRQRRIPEREVPLPPRKETTMKRVLSCLLPILLFLLTLFTAAPALAQPPASEATFLAGRNVSAEDLSYVEEGYALAQRYIDETHGFRLYSPIFVNIRATGAPLNAAEVGESSKGSITIYTRSSGW